MGRMQLLHLFCIEVYILFYLGNQEHYICIHHHSFPYKFWSLFLLDKNRMSLNKYFHLFSKILKEGTSLNIFFVFLAPYYLYLYESVYFRSHQHISCFRSHRIEWGIFLHSHIHLFHFFLS